METLKISLPQSVKESTPCCIYRFNSHYGKFTALYKLISIILATIDESNQVKISREIRWCQGYFFKIALRTKLFIFLQLIMEKVL